MEAAKLLGYFFDDEVEYKAINDNIKNLRHAITGKTKTEQLFDDAKNTMQKLLHKFKGESKRAFVTKHNS